MNLDSTLAVTKTCPKDGVHLPRREPGDAQHPQYPPKTSRVSNPAGSFGRGRHSMTFNARIWFYLEMRTGVRCLPNEARKWLMFRFTRVL